MATNSIATEVITATFTCQPPEQFNFAEPNDWPKWRRRYERFRSVTGMKNKPETEQIDSLIYTMGDQGESILHALKLSEEDSVQYSKVIDAFETHFIGKRNVIYERAKFNMRNQQDGENVDEFITCLHNLARHCSFGALNDELIRDRIVAGVKDRNLSEKMQLDSNLTLEKATTMARQSERIKKQQAVLYDSKEVKIDRVRAPQKKDFSKKQNHSSPNNRQMRSEPKPPGKCYWCGGSSQHNKASCPANKAICNICKKKGHYARVCRSKSDVKEIQSKETAFLGQIGCNETVCDNWTAIVQMRNKEITFKVDTGADVNVLPERYMNDTNIQLQPTDRKLVGPNGQELKTVGMFFEKLTYCRKTVKSFIYVVHDADKPLLSGKTSEELNIIRRVQNVSETSVKLDPFKEFPELFSGLGRASDKYKIVLTPEAKPYALTAPRRVPIPLMDKVKKKLDEMESAGVIESVDEPTEWCSPMVIVPKPSGDIRICVDLSNLNKFIKREIHPMPVSDHILGQLGQARYFSKLDAYWGFWQFELEKESQILTTFITPFGRFKFKRLPFGITSAPEFFQKKMSQVLMGQEGVVCNVDDILVHAKTMQDHDLRLRKTLESLSSAGITLNKDKCEFRTQSVKFLGHLVDSSGIHADPEKVQAIVEMAPPRNVSELKSFLGMVNYHGKFIENLASQVHPLNGLLKSSTAWLWETPQQSAFELLKQKLSTTPILAKFDPSKETTVSSDASSYGLGAVLKQRQDDGSERPVAYASRSLNVTEQRYAQIEKEGLGLVWACERFRDYITGIHIRLETDHKPLIAIFSSKMLDEITPRLQRMKLRLLRFSYDIFHTPGKQLVIADTLSRKPLNVTEDKEFEDEVAAYIQQVVQQTPVSDKLLSSIREEQEFDSVLQDVRRHAKEGWPDKSEIATSLRPYWQHRGEISEVDGLLLKGNRLIIPKSIRKDILHRVHEGHLGINKCRMKARASVWWPGLSNEISELVSSCDICIKEAGNHKEPLLPSTFPNRPWQKVAMDLFYLDGKWYLLVTDYYSRYPEIATLPSLTSKEVISHVKSIFARHGIPEQVISDNGPQFIPMMSSEFGRFAEEWGFEHITSSPRYAQSNGFVEASVKIIKRSIKKEVDGCLALLSYRSTPLENGSSPAELLFGRKIRSRLPVSSHLLNPCLVDQQNLQTKEMLAKNKQKKNYDRRHRTSLLSEIPIQKRVWITDLKKEGRVVGKAKTPRSYIVQTDHGQIRRNRVALIPMRGPYEEPEDITVEEESAYLSDERQSVDSTLGDQGQSNNSNLMPTVSQPAAGRGSPQQIRTRSGRIVKRPKRFEQYVCS